MPTFHSQLAIGEQVSFIIPAHQQDRLGLSDEPLTGRVVAIRITEQKMFYDILGGYHAFVFTNVDSCDVQSLEATPAP